MYFLFLDTFEWSASRYIHRGADKSLARPEWNKLERQKILSFIYPIYNHNWRNVSTVYIYTYIYMCVCVCMYIYITRLTSNEIFLPSNKTHWEVGRAKELSAPLYKDFCLSWESNVDLLVLQPVAILTYEIYISIFCENAFWKLATCRSEKHIIHSFSILSDDRSNASSKTVPPHSAI
jgi:hypothetical protein